MLNIEFRFHSRTNWIEVWLTNRDSEKSSNRKKQCRGASYLKLFKLPLQQNKPTCSPSFPLFCLIAAFLTLSSPFCFIVIPFYKHYYKLPPFFLTLNHLPSLLYLSTILLYPPSSVRWSTWCILWSSCWWCWWVLGWRVRPSSTQTKIRPGCWPETSSSCLTGWSTGRCLPTRLTVSLGSECHSFWINSFFVSSGENSSLKGDASNVTEYI